MSLFFGTLAGSSGSIADRRGSRSSGIRATLGTRRARVRLLVTHDAPTGEDRWTLAHVDAHGVVLAELAAGVLVELPG